jgi:hypothetical protein
MLTAISFVILAFVAWFAHSSNKKDRRLYDVRWPRSFEQNFRVAKWIVGRG